MCRAGSPIPNPTCRAQLRKETLARCCLDPARWTASKPYLYGLDLFNAGSSGKATWSLKASGLQPAAKARWRTSSKPLSTWLLPASNTWKAGRLRVRGRFVARRFHFGSLQHAAIRIKTTIVHGATPLPLPLRRACPCNNEKAAASARRTFEESEAKI
jgi:hypothetical protein